jgi:hypothetical protein
MHFIEQFFGLAPDGGNGFVEVAIFALPFILTLVALRRRKLAKNDGA